MDTPPKGSELFIVDNSDADWKVRRYLADWCQIAQSMDIATGYFEIGSLLALDGQWQKLDQIRILMGDEVTLRTKQAFEDAMGRVRARLDDSLECEKRSNDFLQGVPALVEALRSGRIRCRVYRKDKFHAKAYITHARLEVVGAVALVGSSNFTLPGLSENIELNVQITGRPVGVLQEWYDRHWDAAEDVTPDILRTFERHVRDYAPFEVYARALHELFRRHEMTDREWLETRSSVYRVLDHYQKQGFHELMDIAALRRGAFLCDGVGLGKTLIGLMVIEYLVEYKRQRVVLLVPKSTRKAVWEDHIRRYAPNLRSAFGGLRILNHTDLLRKDTPDVDYPALLSEIRDKAETIVVDEAHHFRNTGIRGEENDRRSRYWQFYDIAKEKTLYLLTATPVNNRLIDLQHMIELFSRGDAGYFKAAPLGIHSLPGHFRSMEKELERLVLQEERPDESLETHQAEADQVLSNDALFRALVVQRSRAYVKKSQEQHGGTRATFPKRSDPQVASYSVHKTCGDLLDKIERAFDKKKPLFNLAVYYPLGYRRDARTDIDPMKEGRQRQVVSLIRIQFLKRFESSMRAFELSCQALLQKLYSWVKKHARSEREIRDLSRWEDRNEQLLKRVRKHYVELYEEEGIGEEEDVIVPELLDDIEELSRDDYRIEEMIGECMDDLHQIADFLDELWHFKAENDDKLRTLLRLLSDDPVLKRHKVLIFTEYMHTARYLKQELEKAGVEGVDEVDSAASRDRLEIIQRFAPYYNGLFSAELKTRKWAETRILISTDVLSEGLNLQDATRLVNYDLHWNPVRLMQRIGRVDRRMNPETERRILADHPDQAPLRGTVAYWNFLPPDDLNRLLRLYQKVSHKTLRISKTFGIEGRKLLKPEDDYEALRDFTRAYDGATTPVEKMLLEYQKLLLDDPALIGRINAQPGRVFSGKAHTTPGTWAVFFCYALPGCTRAAGGDAAADPGPWTEDAGVTKWYLYDVATEQVKDDPAGIIEIIRCAPPTPRKNEIPAKKLAAIRAHVEKYIKNTYLKQVQAPIGVSPALKCWMELS